MKRIILTIFVILSVASLSMPAAADHEPWHPGEGNETGRETPTPVPTPEAGENVTYVLSMPGDPAVRVVEYSYRKGVFRIVFEADTLRRVTVTAPPESTSSGAGSGNLKSVDLPSGRTVVTLQSPKGEVWITTTKSVENGHYAYLRTSGGSILGGPYSASDVRLSAVGGALSVAIAVLFRAAQAKIGGAQEGERVV